MITPANYAAMISGHASNIIETCALYYDRRQEQTVIPLSLRDYVKGSHHLYLKQVPSALTLRKAGTRVAESVKPFLLEEGFNIFSHYEKDEDSSEKSEEVDSSIDQFQSEQDSFSDNMSEELDVPFADIPQSGAYYEDPWKILAGWAYAQTYLPDKPEVSVWPGGCHRLQGKLHPTLCRSDRKNSVSFTHIESHEEKMYLLFNHTHWGHRIQVARRSGKDGREKDPLKFFAETLFRRISFLLNGRYDPLWTREEREKFLHDPSHVRSKRERARRFIEVLKTVDGLFLQRYLSFPEEEWSWEKYDLYILQNLSILITDEFFDGVLTDYSMSLKTNYSSLKAARKLFKSVIHRDEPSKHDACLDLDVPRWIQSSLRPVWKLAIRMKGYQRLFVAGILSQTRGSGTPPPLLVLASKEKFILSVQEAPPSISKSNLSLISKAMDLAVESIPQEVFTGLDTKARVTVTGSACWEETRRSGGTAQAVLDILGKYEGEKFIPIRNLDTGNIDEWRRKDDFESVGTAVFFACLQEVLDTDPEHLGDVFLTLVREPGKARAVTKGIAALKIILDTVSKICSWPLKKGFKSSESGMGKSHHGWNLFKDMFSEELYDTLFHENRSRREEDIFADHLERIVVWDDCFAGSTDYQEATDRMVHTFAEKVGIKWMRKCGIPNILVGIVVRVCYRPRRVYFTGTGPLSKYGTSTEDPDTRYVVLRRGVLMGDPLTKVVLHFSNIIARQLGSSLVDGSIYTLFRNGNEGYATYLEKIQERQTQSGRTPRLG